MTNWIEHNGGPQPVEDDVWVAAEDEGYGPSQAWDIDWGYDFHYRILNQHLIDAARLEGIRLGLEAAAYGSERIIRALDPETIAREAVLDQLTREAQEQNMGYDNEPR